MSAGLTNFQVEEGDLFCQTLGGSRQPEKAQMSADPTRWC